MRKLLFIAAWVLALLAADIHWTAPLFAAGPEKPTGTRQGAGGPDGETADAPSGEIPYTGKGISILPEKSMLRLYYEYDKNAGFRNWRDSGPIPELSYHLLSFRVIAPVRRKRRSFITQRITYNFLRFRFDNLPQYYNGKPIYAHSLFPDLSLLFPVSDDWVIGIGGGPIFSADLEEITRDIIRWKADLFASWKPTDSVRLMLGAELSEDLTQDYIGVPIVGLAYRSEDLPFSLDLMVPSYAIVRYRVSNWFTLFAKGDVRPYKVHLTEETGGVKRSHKLHIVDSNAGGGARISFKYGFSLEIFSGTTAYRTVRLDLPDASGRIVREKYGIDPNFFIRTTLSFTPRPKEEQPPKGTVDRK